MVRVNRLFVASAVLLVFSGLAAPAQALPPSPDDDRIRIVVFRAVYGRAGLDLAGMQAKGVSGLFSVRKVEK